MKKKNILLIGIPVFAILITFALSTLTITKPQPNKCEVQTKTITKIKEGTSYDIIFKDTNGESYYINRGLERGLNLEALNTKVLNKTVTLHLAKVLGGFATSNHIAQLSIGDAIIFTEFN